MANIGVKIAVLGLGWLFQTAAGAIEQPAMERTAQPAILDTPVSQIRPAMRTPPPNQRVAIIVFTIKNQILAHEPHRHRRPAGRQLLGQRRRLPIAPQQSTGLRLRRAPGHKLILFGGQHVLV